MRSCYLKIGKEQMFFFKKGEISDLGIIDLLAYHLQCAKFLNLLLESLSLSI